jgi:hypothetical protein
MNHDQLFKELLTTFFVEFLDLFFPPVLGYLDVGSVEFLDKEIFTDVTSGEAHEVDLVAKCRVRGQAAFFLVHVEAQEEAQADFGRRMFRYFARLYDRHDLPVYPVVLFTGPRPKQAAPSRHTVTFPDFSVLCFEYRVVQLSQLRWRDFLERPNPVAAALMAKMPMTAEERPQVKAECLRLLATLRLDRARMRLISGFVDSSLRLTSAEYNRFETAVARVAPSEREGVMEIVTSWMEQGIAQGMQQGLARGRQEGHVEGRLEGRQEARALLARMIERRFGALTPTVRGRLDSLSVEDLEAFGEALWDCHSTEDVAAWLETRRPG